MAIVSELSNSRNITAAALAAQHAAANTRYVGIDTRPDLSDKSPAFRLGYEDGTQRAPFAPEVWFTGAYRQSSYTLGFLTAQPGNPVACDWWNQFIDTDAEDRRIAMDNAAAVRESQMGAW